jgi:2-dehydropantoate 2-reductase
MSKKVAVLGTGGTGSVIGGMLTKAGHDVTLIDQWPAHVEAMKAQGLHMALREEEFLVPVQAYHLHEVCHLNQQFDVVFLACKSYDTVWMVQFIMPYLSPDGVLVSAQNSLNDEWIAPLIGHTRDVGCVITMSSEVFQPGRVKRNTAMDLTVFTLGELHGRITSRLQELQQLLSAAGKVELTTNIWGRKWAKLVFNSTTAPVCALAGVGPATVAEAPERVRVCLKLGQEALQVGLALGYAMEPVFGLTMAEAVASPEALVDHLGQGSKKEGVEARSFFHQDVLKGRATEVDYINHLVSRKGRQAGVPTPMNDAASDMVKRLEREDLRPDPANIWQLEAAVTAQ